MQRLCLMRFVVRFDYVVFSNYDQLRGNSSLSSFLASTRPPPPAKQPPVIIYYYSADAFGDIKRSKTCPQQTLAGQIRSGDVRPRTSRSAGFHESINAPPMAYGANHIEDVCGWGALIYNNNTPLHRSV